MRAPTLCLQINPNLFVLLYHKILHVSIHILCLCNNYIPFYYFLKVQKVQNRDVYSINNYKIKKPPCWVGFSFWLGCRDTFLAKRIFHSAPEKRAFRSSSEICEPHPTTHTLWGKMRNNLHTNKKSNGYRMVSVTFLAGVQGFEPR